ncbi:inorganic diphosphatase [Rhodocytophaga rosea]|uniref:Inorganic pyrophosphatase n=1 Tax=Rhodocytophaga rosea TaxID=2704465 RepID=A0A6C0GXS9_9BACT|nr:inorganic diphosphatase [Rhodocytophaga rosea]QHT72260.1 inorganic diphosphatase [Rhodocytophaga rosea]
MKHPWHQVNIGRYAPEIVRGIIEIPQGSKAKYELDKESGLLTLDRVLFSSVNYPANYGFIPQTYGEDHDPLDILILSQIDIVPLCIVEAKVIGVMRMLDSGEADDKIIAVAAQDMSVNYIEDIAGLPPHFVHELKNFFEDYKKLENKEVIVEEFFGKAIAQQIILDGIALYKKEFGHKAL